MNGHNGQLKALVERIERLNEEEAAIKEDKRSIFAEAKAAGFDPKVLRRVIQIRAGDAAEQEEFETLVDTYLAALGQGNAFARDARESTAEVLAQRSKERLSEAMADNKVFVEELAKAGLISEEARAENVALSDAVAEQLGAGIKKPDDDLEIPAFLDRRNKPVGPASGEPLT